MRWMPHSIFRFGSNSLFWSYVITKPSRTSKLVHSQAFWQTLDDLTVGYCLSKGFCSNIDQCHAVFLIWLTGAPLLHCQPLNSVVLSKWWFASLWCFSQVYLFHTLKERPGWCNFHFLVIDPTYWLGYPNIWTLSCTLYQSKANIPAQYQYLLKYVLNVTFWSIGLDWFTLVLFVG